MQRKHNKKQNEIESLSSFTATNLFSKLQDVVSESGEAHSDMSNSVEKLKTLID